MSFSSRMRTKKNITLPDIENTNLYNTQRCYNTNGGFPPGPLVPIPHAPRIRIPTVLNPELGTLTSDMSTATVDCILPSEFSTRIYLTLT